MGGGRSKEYVELFQTRDSVLLVKKKKDRQSSRKWAKGMNKIAWRVTPESR